MLDWYFFVTSYMSLKMFYFKLSTISYKWGSLIFLWHLNGLTEPLPLVLVWVIGTGDLLRYVGDCNF